MTRGRERRRSKSCDESLRRAREALVQSQTEKHEVEKQVSLMTRLKDGWERVHARNSLSELFTAEYRRTR